LEHIGEVVIRFSHEKNLLLLFEQFIFEFFIHRGTIFD